MIESVGASMHRAALLPATALISFAAVASELDDGTVVFDAETPAPPGVLSLVECGTEDSPYVTGQPFAHGFVFAIQCPGNNENFVQTLIFAADQQGNGARLLRFRGPGQRRDGFEDVLSNICWYPDRNEIGEIAVDSDPDSRPTPNICRSEARWRLEGTPPEPRLVFWRETADCKGMTGWKIIIGKQ
jgi:hypothetical protein